MNIKLKKIGKDNWNVAAELAVADDHKKYVASNLYSIAEVQFHPGLNAYALYNDDTMIGFAMYGVEEDSDREDLKDPYPGSDFWIWRFMIAEGERFKGYGKEAMKLIIADAIKAGKNKVFLSTEPSNEKAIKFYKTLGFRTTGVIEDGEEIFVLKLS